ncbi:ATP synthase F1 subunit gamma [Pontibacter qinzhouensis]|uniref:ATP synthase gamma chain n=1 Tax=Pontibacter qinzhouensis TaxID=2603253 RepID=A0A5C8JHD9_9BACT|nr:ATP synthase F1 subunit gamma [Pontibacter qinzhouensis]TXK37169.1 ATP synthase F1 subunit gamma [Pontibacter qinzhouensis]
MASLKEVRARITSVSSTQQITKAMKMVAAAKLRRAQDNIMRMRPYAQRLSGILTNLSAITDQGSVTNVYSEKREVNRVLIMAVTSDRGLAGAFNSNIIKAATTLVAGKYKSQFEAGNVTFLGIGKKGHEAFMKKGYNTIGEYSTLFSNLSFDTVRVAAERAMDGFVNKEFDEVVLVYNEFKNVATQIVRTEQFLPIEDQPADVAAANTMTADYTFEPSKEEIIVELIPKSLKIQVYKAVLESNASEHGARMTAMDKATENAGELLKQLKLTYNRTRQAAITNEILEIVGGAEALAAK